MGTVTLLPETTVNPISLIGRRAGYCWGADISDDEKNYKRGLDCIKSDHGRTFEFVNIDFVLDGYSARVIREYMRHVGGGLSVLQASTRYINEGNFKYITPPSIAKNEDALKEYDDCMNRIKACYKYLEEINIPKEDVALCLPLGMETKLVDHKNLRNLADMSHKRLCSRAYHEYRKLFNDITKALNDYSDEWKEVTELLFKPQCEVLGRCPEKKSCGRF